MSDNEDDYSARIDRHHHGDDPGDPSCPECKKDERAVIVAEVDRLTTFYDAENMGQAFRAMRHLRTTLLGELHE